jgi:hypothetical protein
MAKRDSLRLPGSSSVETGSDWNGRYWIGYRKGCSMFFRDAQKLRKWLELPPAIPSRIAFDSWVESIQTADAERTTRKQHQQEGLSEEYLATGFGPEAHGLDTSDPNHSTRTII